MHLSGHTIFNEQARFLIYKSGKLVKICKGGLNDLSCNFTEAMVIQKANFI